MPRGTAAQGDVKTSLESIDETGSSLVLVWGQNLAQLMQLFVKVVLECQSSEPDACILRLSPRWQP